MTDEEVVRALADLQSAVRDTVRTVETLMVIDGALFACVVFLIVAYLRLRKRMMPWR